MEDKKLKLLSLLNDVEFLLPFYDNHIVVLVSEEDKIYIPLFTNITERCKNKKLGVAFKIVP
ncbi:MAG: hypothetical protein IJO33_00110 [Bacilli bacterium]|nr:hypothetical protein [Bacilli bacterium]